MRRPRLSSLRTELVLVTLGVLVASFAAVGVVTAVAMHTFLVHRLDQQLAAAGARFAAGLEQPSDGDADNAAEPFSPVAGQAVGTIGARVDDGRVTAMIVVGGQDATAPLRDDTTAALAGLPLDNRPRRLSLPGLGDYRVLVAAGDDGDRLVTGLPEHPVEDTVTRLVVIESVVFGIVLVIAGLASAGLIRIALRPLADLSSTARRVAALPMGTGTGRVPPRAAVPRQADSEVGQLATTFNGMLDQVQAALSRRHDSEDRLRRFLADASHELRTPIAVISAHADYARRTTEPDQQAASLDRIEAESQRMGHLVEDLLLLARLDSGRPLAHDDVDLTRVVLDSVTDARVTGSAHHWRLALPGEPLTLSGDERALRQVLANLLGNARTHTPPGTTVSTTLDSVEGRLRLQVGDDGGGIDPEVHDRVFERFARGRHPEGHGPNSGLGLAIVEAIVRAHAGSIHLDSGEGRTLFTIELPADRALAP